MKRLLLAAFAAIALSGSANADNIRFAYRPSLSPDGKQIYFSYDGDIYRTPLAGGQATAVITMRGNQSSPLVSPDGKWLAFSSDIQGNSDVYVVPVDGGKAVQLTFHEAADVPVSWSADSKWIHFESTRGSSRKTTYRVRVDGGTPELMFQGFFNTVVNLVENPKTGEYLFNESMESISFPTRKRYVGDHNPNIKSWNPRSKSYTELTDYIGKDTWPMVDSKGNIYYVTDELNQESNIVKYVKGGKAAQLTSFDKSVQYPSIAFNGSAIVFLKDYEINVLDLASGKVSVPQISVAAGDVEVRRLFADQSATDGAISPDGKKLALVIRGQLYVSDAKCKFYQKLETPANERVAEVAWSSDNKTIYYTRTNLGWTNLFRIAADGSSAEQPVYYSSNNVKNLSVSHKGDKMAFVEGSHNVMLCELESGSVSKLTEAEFWSFQGYTLNFSWDDSYLAFNAVHNFENDIFLYSFNDGKTVNLTNSSSVEDEAVFSPDGKYLFITGNPTSTSFPRGMSSSSLYRLPLQKYDKPFKSEEYDKLFAADEKKDEGKDVKKDDKKVSEKKDSTIKIDFKDIYRRLEVVARGRGQGNLFTWQSKDKQYLIYSSYGDKSGFYTLEISDPEAKPKEIKDLRYGKIFASKDAVYAFSNGTIYKIDPAAGSSTKVSEVKKSVEKVLADEFSQMLYETWAVLEQNYYDVNFHGADWPAVRDYYTSFLPYVRTRADLRTLAADMLGELNSSHLGFTSVGNEEWTETRIRSFQTGIVFDNTSPYSVDRVLAGSVADKVEIDIRKGDKLVAVNGTRVDQKQNREKYFTSALSKDEIKLTFSRSGKEFDVKMHTSTSADVKALEYREWEDQRKEMVEKKTGGRVGYIHMRAMGESDLNDFLLSMHTDVDKRDALILDLRYNNGGNVHNDVINFLRGQEHFRWSYRDFPTSSHPSVAPAGMPIVVLVNEHSLSDAEVTSNGIKTLGIAKLVGTETYRWIIFTSSVRMLDGSTCRMPAWGCYSVTGEDLEHTGVKPDIYVKNTFKDRLENKDPQLDAAIAEVLRQLN